ncbi:MAG: phage virion morphogenesis protein [Brevundimonas sp.]|uniref:phage virion morphogenesis protein n=1 Tax=Brevundimonas sp. TaxID=1871086 RepID=UPI002720E0F5|nr:phage virion morphogenesis protein [Brevundimonas sp.]MDO9607220.1 phage virion morphogenesis protein [Brevundimonas sp.]
MADRADELARLKEIASAFLEQMEPAAKSKLLRRFAHDIRRSQQRRIGSQLAPDGSPWPKRKAREGKKPATRAVRFLYRKSGGEIRLADMRSWIGRGAMITGFDREAEGIRTFRKDRIAQHLPPAGDADPGALPDSIRGARGGVRRKAQKMFTALRSNAHLKAGATPDEAWVAFTGQASRIARVHHYGLRDRVTPDGPETDYPQRELLGFSQADDEHLLSRFLEHVGSALKA